LLEVPSVEYTMPGTVSAKARKLREPCGSVSICLVVT
jgi:hypothetical protein